MFINITEQKFNSPNLIATLTASYIMSDINDVTDIKKCLRFTLSFRIVSYVTRHYPELRCFVQFFIKKVRQCGFRNIINNGVKECNPLRHVGEKNEKDESNRFECVVLIQMMKWKNAFEKQFETHTKKSLLLSSFPFFFHVPIHNGERRLET